MKTVAVPPQAAEINALLEQARDDELLVRTTDRSSCLPPSTSSMRKSPAPGKTPS